VGGSLPGEFQMEGKGVQRPCVGGGVWQMRWGRTTVLMESRGRLVWGKAGEGRRSRLGLWEWGLDPKSIAGMQDGQLCLQMKM